MGSGFVAFQVVGGIYENLVDGVWVDVFRRDILQIDLVYSCAIVDIIGHPRRSYEIIQLKFRTSLQFLVKMRLACKCPIPDVLSSLTIDFIHFLYHLEQPGTATHSVGFQGWGNCEADGFIGTAFVSNDQICSQRIKATFHTLDRCVERLQVDGYVGSLLHRCKSNQSATNIANFSRTIIVTTIFISISIIYI